jgi:hypothetical protein
MSDSRKLPDDDPRIVAWNEYRATQDYANTRNWALHKEHVDGSLWAAFLAGHALAQAAATIAERRMEEMRKALERIAASMPGNTHKENSVARQEIARAALRPSGGV